MATTLYTANPNALIPQAGRTVDAFPSGLVRVSQTFLGRTANAATHRATLAVGNNMPGGDSSPCVDGLKIFPEVQERRREDGLTEYSVSAYGRASMTGQNSSIIKRVSFPEMYLQLSPRAVLPKVEFLYYSPLKKIVAPVGQIPNLAIQAPDFQILPSETAGNTFVENQIVEIPSNVKQLRTFGFWYMLSSQGKKWAIRTFNPESLSVVYRTFSHRDQKIINVNSLNFGDFDELVIEYDFVPFAALGSQSDFNMHDSSGTFLAPVSSLFA